MNKFKSNREISDNTAPFVIAEIGINHEGSIDKAVQMVDDAADAGCECASFSAISLKMK